MYKIERQWNWGQENPRDQLRALLGSIQGDVSNMQAGVGNKVMQLLRIEKFLEQCQQLARSLPPGEWE